MRTSRVGNHAEKTPLLEPKWWNRSLRESRPGAEIRRDQRRFVAPQDRKHHADPEWYREQQGEEPKRFVRQPIDLARTTALTTSSRFMCGVTNS